MAIRDAAGWWRTRGRGVRVRQTRRSSPPGNPPPLSRNLQPPPGNLPPGSPPPGSPPPLPHNLQPPPETAPPASRNLLPQPGQLLP